MALKTSDLKPKESGSTVEEGATEGVVPQSGNGTFLLQLRFIKRYNRHGVIYESGVVYRFTEKQAVVLLAEAIDGKSVWKVWRPEAKKPVVVKKPVIAENQVTIKDETGRQLAENEAFDDPTQSTQRIDIGNDEEVEAILNTGDVVQV